MNSNQSFKLPIILYDANCELCSRFKVALQKIPGTEKFTFVSIWEKEIYATYPELDPVQCEKVIHIFTEDKTIYKGPDAIAFLVHQYPVVEKFAWLLETDMGKKTLDFFYDMALKYREKSQKKCGSCNKNK